MSANGKVDDLYKSEDRTEDKRSFCGRFFAFPLERTLEFKLARAYLPNSPQQIREALNSMNFTEVKIKKEVFY